MNTMFAECGNFSLSCTAAAADNGSGMPHPSSWRSSQPCNKADNRFAHLFGNICCSFLLCCPTDLPNNYDTLGIRIGFKGSQAVYEVRTITGSPPIPRQVVWPMDCLESWSTTS